MHRRCLSPTSKNYANYGGRGIKVCPEWEDFCVFYADMGPRPAGRMSLDRIDPSGDYCKENCRWVDYGVQANNKRNTNWIEYQGKTYALSVLATHLGFTRNELYQQIVIRKRTIQESIKIIMERKQKRELKYKRRRMQHIREAA